MIFANSKGQPIYSGKYLQNCDSCPCGPGCVFTPIYASPFLMGLNGSDLITGAEINTMFVNGIELRLTWNSEELGVRPGSGDTWISSSTFSRNLGTRMIYAKLTVQHDLIPSPFIFNDYGTEFGNYYYNYYNLFIYEYDESGNMIHPNGYNYSARYQRVSITDRIASGNVIRGSSEFPGLSLQIPAANSWRNKYDFIEMANTGNYDEIRGGDFLVFAPGVTTGGGDEDADAFTKREVYCYYSPAYLSVGNYSITFAKNDSAKIGIYTPPEDDPEMICPDNTVVLGPVTGYIDPIMTTFMLFMTITKSSGRESRSAESMDSIISTGKCVYELLYECSYDAANSKFKWDLIEITVVGMFWGSEAGEMGYTDGIAEKWDNYLLYVRVERTTSSSGCGVPARLPELEPCSPENCGDPVEATFSHISQGIPIGENVDEYGEYLIINGITPPTFSGGQVVYEKLSLFCEGELVADSLTVGSAVYMEPQLHYALVGIFTFNSFEIPEGSYTIGTVKYSVCPAAATETDAMLAEMGE